MEDNINESHPPGGENKPDGTTPDAAPQKKSAVGMKVVGINILILAIYTVLCSLDTSGGGFILDALLILIHVVVCIIMALAKRSWLWLLSAALVLAIGFSTCISFGSLGSMH